MAVSPAQMGFPHVLQLARLDRIRAHKSGKQEVETVWLITSLSPQQANAARLLELARQDLVHRKRFALPPGRERRRRQLPGA